jgi:hypothetical protein
MKDCLSMVHNSQIFVTPEKDFIKPAFNLVGSGKKQQPVSA